MIEIVFAVVGGLAFASSEIPDVDMHAVTREVMALQRYMFSEAEFVAPKNEAAIRDSFPILEKHLTRLKEKVFRDEPALRANVSMLSEQISDADRAFREGDKSYARYVLVSSLQMCVACHTRTASADFALPEPELKGAGTLDRANYYYATRQFDKGRELFEKFLADSGKQELPGLVRSASLALAVYYARVKSDPKGGAAYFSKIAKKRKFSSGQRSEFEAWAREFRRWSSAKGDEAAVSDVKAMERARQLLKQKSGPASGEIRGLRASALLHSVLEAPGEASPLKAEALLRLGGIYEALNFPLYYRFGDMYLKACVSDYKKTKAAQDCYDALDGFVKGRVRHGASEGTANIEEAELLRWKKLAY